LTWVDIKELVVPGLDRAPSEVARRFYSCEIRELIDVESYFVREWFKDCKTWLDVVTKVIKEIQYPFDWFGRPTDLHYMQAFRKYPGRCHRSYKIEFDFWQRASETAFMKMGDCEDSSVLCGAGLYLKGYDFWVEFGLVYEVSNGQCRLLGGHAWVISEREHGKWYLVETTLDKVPKRFPEVHEDAVYHYVGRLRYEALLRFNKYRVQVSQVEQPILLTLTTVKKHTRKREKKKIEVIRREWAKAGYL